MDENWDFPPLHWVLCDQIQASIYHTCIGTPLNLSMVTRVRLVHQCTSKQGNNIYTAHITPQECAMGRWIKLKMFYGLPRIVCDVPWTQIIHIGVDTPLNSSMGTCVRLT